MIIYMGQQLSRLTWTSALTSVCPQVLLSDDQEKCIIIARKPDIMPSVGADNFNQLQLQYALSTSRIYNSECTRGAPIHPTTQPPNGFTTQPDLQKSECAHFPSRCHSHLQASWQPGSSQPTTTVCTGSLLLHCPRPQPDSISPLPPQVSAS